MKKMRKYVVFLLIISIVFVGCNKSKDSQDKPIKDGESIENQGNQENDQSTSQDLNEAESGHENGEELIDGEDSKSEGNQDEVGEGDQLEQEEGDKLKNPEFSAEDGYQMLLNVITPSYYSIKLEDESFSYEDSLYYMYTVANTTTEQVDQIIVDIFSGRILCYKDGNVSDFEDFLFENIISESMDSSAGLTKDEAKTLLKSIPKEILGLSKDITEYNLVFDDYTSNIEGKESYCINVFSKEDGEDQPSVGAYYVALDGSAVYYFDPVEDMMVQLLQ